MMNFENFPSPILLQGNACTAYRDPAVYYLDGTFYFYFTRVETEADEKIYLYLAMTTSRDLRNFTTECKLSPRDQFLNFSSPGNVIRHQGKFLLCCQTYCRENGEKYGNDNSRIWLRESSDLLNWDEPRLMRVKGDAVPPEKVGRMIDPYLIQKPDGEWFCFFKQNGVSFSRSHDLLHWEFCGSAECGENVCVVKDRELYRMWHSPRNGIGEMVSHDLLHWRDTGKLITLGQENWPWAQGRLTAGFVLDLRNEVEIGKALLFFHGTGPENEEVVFDQYACIGFAWSDDLQNWQFVREACPACRNVPTEEKSLNTTSCSHCKT